MPSIGAALSGSNTLLPRSFAAAVAGAREWIVVATIDAVTRPAPLPVGEQLLVWDGGVVGTVSAGCVDADVVTVAHQVLADGHARTRVYGPDGAPLAATTCGGTLRIGIERIAVTTPAATLDEIACRSGRVAQSAPGRRLFAIGATTVADEIARLAGPLGYRTVVIDPRPAFATRMQCPSAHEVLCGWPDRIFVEATPTADDALVLLTHDERYSSAILESALLAGLSYVGALGSGSTAAGHREELARRGLRPEAVTRLHSPVGVPIGAVGPTEIAVSVAADLIRSARG